MSDFDWQLIVVILTLATAAIYLVRRGMKTFRSSRRSATGAGSCGSCGSCSTLEQAAGDSPTGFVPLESLAAKKPRS